LFTPPSVRAEELALPLLWSVDLKTFLESAPVIADIDGDGMGEVLVAGREEMIALDGSGKELWRWRAPGRFMTYPTVLERPGQTPLIYGADYSGALACLDGAGNEVWQAKLDAPSSWSAAVAGDLNRDGVPEVVQTDESGAVWGFDATTGKVIWKTVLKGTPVSPAMGDLDGDGGPEIVAATGAGLLAALDGAGRVLWTREIGGASPTWSTSAPVIFGASDGSRRVAAASSNGWVFCLDKEGAVLWRRFVRGPVASTISVGDLEPDGRADILVITQLGVIFRFDEAGRVLWDIDMQGRSLAAGAILDINGDGALEYVCCTQAGHLMVLNEQGGFLFHRQFNTRTINVTPAFGDITPDSPGLEMVITGGEAGLALCLGTAATEDAAAQWTTYRGDLAKTGAWFGLGQEKPVPMTPENLAWDQIVTGGHLQFAVHAPDGAAGGLKATAVCVWPSGTRQVATSDVIGQRGVLQMPTNFTVPGTYRISWFLTDAAGAEVFSGAREFAFQPFANDRAIASRAVQTLHNAADAVKETLPLSARALRGEAMSLEADTASVAALQDAVPGADPATEQEAVERTAALTVRAQRGLRISDIAHQAATLGPQTSLIAFGGTLWENRGVDSQLPARVASPLTVVRRAVLGEHEPMSVKLLNVTDRDLDVRVHVEAGEGGPVVTAYRAVAVPTSEGDVSWDALAELDEAGMLSIPSLSSREVWFDVDLGAVKPGDHTVKVRFQALNGAGVLDAPKNPHSVPPPETVAEMLLHVLSFEPAPSGACRLCTWAAPEGPQVRDLLAHGNNVFCVPHGEPQYDAQGQLAGVDFGKLDRILEAFRGKDVVLLLNGIPSLRGDFGSPAYRNDLRTFLDASVSHMAEMGFDTQHFALYPIDEPGGAGWEAVNRFVSFGEMVRAANPEIMMYVDGGGELPMFEAMAPYVDIWCPGIYMLPEDSPVMSLVRNGGKTIWSYNCGYSYARPVGANLKHVNIIAEYRAAALFAFRYGATGIGFWCYNAGEDPWTRVELEYALVYPGKDEPVTSRRWEAVREGIEDYRILTALRQRLDEKDGGTLAEDVRVKINRLLDVSLPGWIDQSFKEMTVGCGRYVLDATNNDVVVNEFRNEMLDCVEAVAGR
jgi:outer membrane protein assembly factor BamB